MKRRLLISLAVASFLIVFSFPPARGGGGKPVQISFGSQTNGVPWELRPKADRLSVKPGNLVRGVFRLRSRAANQVSVLVRHRFEPPEMIRYLPTIECGLQFTITMDPGEEHEFESEFFLREGVPDGVKNIKIVFTFELLDEPFGSNEVLNGRKIYLSRCVTCHGTKGRGDTPLARRMVPRPSDLRAALKGRNDWQLLRSLTEGKGMMPAFSPALDESELRYVLHFLRKSWGSGG